MAKPSNESLTLPDFEVSIVSKVDNQWLEDNINLSQWQTEQNHGLILYFYPKDNTPGCTTQANDFTAHSQAFSTLGYTVIGVSRDSIDTHKKFIDQQNIQIPLISDEDEQLCQYFDVIKEKNMYGKKILGLVRSAFVFNQAGYLTHAQRNLRAKGYAERLLTLLPEA